MGIKKAVVVGSLNMDVILRVDRLPQKGETRISSDFFVAGGGKGANQAIAMGRLGVNVSMIGKIGNDEFGESLLKS